MSHACLCTLTFLAIVLGSPAAFPAAGTLSVRDLRCEGLLEAEQVDTPTPRFSWRLETVAPGTRQVAYQLRVGEIDAQGKSLAPMQESMRITSDATQGVPLPGFIAKARATYALQIRAWDNHGIVSDWSEAKRFSTGLLGAKWPADWLGNGQPLGLHKTAPARIFRHTFKVEQKPVRARLFISAFGLVEPWLNGQPATRDQFVPGWPDYRQRLFYASYDVTSLIRVGENIWGAMLGDGWYSGTMLPQHQYGQEAKFSAFIDLTFSDGKVTTLTTNKDWRWTEDGPITLNSIYQGETYDARREDAYWCTPGARSPWTWREVSVRLAKHVYLSMTARLSPPIRRIETRIPVSVKKTDPGVFVYDLGQNMVGWARLRVRAPAGREIKLRFAEMLGPDGRVFTGNLRKAKATAIYIAKGQGLEEWEPRFTYFGFRYVELSGLDSPEKNAVEGIVLHNDLSTIGTFECSDPMLNQLHQNALWSQKGNFFEVPTDCPQRDERLGWSGDAQVFAPTAFYNMDSGTFFRQWLYSLRDSYREGRGFPDTAPHTGWGFGSTGWGDAGIIIPWVTYLHTGDRRVLEENYPMILHALEQMALDAPDGIRRNQPAWGDWLSPGYEMYKAPPRNELLATAYYAHGLDLAARMGDVLGRPHLAKHHRSLREKAKAAFQREFIAPDGRMVDDVQTSYLMALAFDLVTPSQQTKLSQHLVRTFTEKDNHLATGFLGTPLITPVLTSIGRVDLAYTVLGQITFPGWLLSVKNGATTIWERWDSYTREGGFNKHGMNSFNHYASGSVVSWFYDTIAGLKPLAEAPGWKRFQIAPVPGGGLTSAKAGLHTPHGLAESAWKIDGDTFSLSVRIPPNTRADVLLPTANSASVRVDGTPLGQSKQGQGVRTTGGKVQLTLPSGSYQLQCKLRK